MELVRSTGRCYFRLFHFTTFTGQENIPPEGAVIFAPNHQSYYDPMLMQFGQNRMVKFMAWEALFRIPVFGQLITNWGAFPVDPQGRGETQSYRITLHLLEKGSSVVIFPEGGRSFGTELMPLREGVARLAIRAGVPIVPVRITGAHHAWPRGELGPRPFFPIHLRYQPPIEPRTGLDAQERKVEIERILDDLRRSIGENGKAAAS